MKNERMRLVVVTICGTVAVAAFSHAAMAVEANADEKPAAHQWCDAAFGGVIETASPNPGLEVVANRDRVQKNARYGTPLTIAGTKYDRGLFCRAPSRITVRLPGPARQFQAVIGIDDGLRVDNRDWPSGPLWPELTFAIRTADKQVFRSGPLKTDSPGVPVNADLSGVSEFTLDVSGVKFDAWGEADWADAKVILADGRTVWLDELPMAAGCVNLASAAPPFSFTYDGKPSGDFLKDWKRDYSSRQLDATRREHTLVYTDAASGLVVRCVAIEYSDFPTVEWTVHFGNTGKKDTPLLEAIRAIDISLTRGPTSEFVLHHSLGSSCRRDDYRPSQTVLEPGVAKRFAPVTGYSSDPLMPYFNVELPSGEGLIVAVGWPGQWAAEFARDKASTLQIRAGQELTHFRLHPGEDVRTPLIAMQFYTGDPVRAQNLWRRWMTAYGLPKPGGKSLAPMAAAMNTDVIGYTNTSEVNQKECIDRYLAKGFKFDWWWIDYGWHKDVWQADTTRYPNGLRAVTDYARSKGMKTILWFAPEHSPFGANSKWLLKARSAEPLCQSVGSLCKDGEVSVLDLGNPDALKWIIETVDKVITKEKIDCYRHDTAMGPLTCWRVGEADDRQGITENKYICGFLAFFDELQRRHPDLLIDNCCRGGRRLDLECMRRSVPLWRSDIAYNDPTSHQGQTYGLSSWIPFYGTGTLAVAGADRSYTFRSFMCPSLLLSDDVRRGDVNYGKMRRLHDQYRKIAANFLGDFYPLTPYTMSDEAWMAWQFDRPAEGKGIIQAFRRPNSPDEIRWLKLQGLDPAATYTLTDIDVGVKQSVLGRVLMEKGTPVRIPVAPGAMIIQYEKAAGASAKPPK
jgi:alpha-galactosidase